jgi:hypothetical protein
MTPPITLVVASLGVCGYWVLISLPLFVLSIALLSLVLVRISAFTAACLCSFAPCLHIFVVLHIIERTYFAELQLPPPPSHKPVVKDAAM